MIVQPSSSKVNSVRELYCCWFACACLSSWRRCSQLQHYPNTMARGPMQLHRLEAGRPCS